MSCYRCGRELTTADRPNTGLCCLCEDSDRSPAIYQTYHSLCGANGHMFVFTAGGTDARVPDGTPCSCGRVTAKWVRCEHCGQDKLTQVPVYPGNPSFTGDGICVAPGGICHGCIPPEGCEGCEHLRPNRKDNP